MSQPELEEAYLLLRKAREDADAVRKFCADPDLADAVVGFHAQQATEKALKAVLAAFGDDFPWTHDLRHLMERLDAVRTPLPASLYEIPRVGSLGSRVPLRRDDRRPARPRASLHPRRRGDRLGRGARCSSDTYKRFLILPDVIAPDLRVVFCGTALGDASARAGAWPIDWVSPTRSECGSRSCVSCWSTPVTRRS